MEKKQPLVSIIVAAYNEEKYIGRLIESVKSQSYPLWEMVIVDDNSKDSTFNVIKAYSSSDSRIKALQQAPGTRGPGNAWNLAARHSNGDILFFEGADTVLGSDYISKMVQPIIEGKAIGTLHQEEKVANKASLWARAFGTRKCVDNDNQGIIFGAIMREYYDKAGGFDPSLGYGDDKTLYMKLKIKSLGVDAEIHHHNPERFSEIWRHHKWVGASYKNPLLIIAGAPFFPVWVAYKSIRQIREDPNINFIWFLPLYNTIRYAGYSVGAFKKLFEQRIY